MTALSNITQYAANGASTTPPTLDDYTAAGILFLNSNSLTRYNAEIHLQTVLNVDTRGEIQRVVNRINAFDQIITYAESNSAPAPTLTDYDNVRVTGVTSANLSQINAAIQAKIGIDVDTTIEIQDVINSVLNPSPELEHIKSYADANNGTAPTASEYTTLGITTDLPNGKSLLSLLNATLARTDITSADVNTKDKINSLINQFSASNLQAYSAANTAALTLAQLEGLTQAGLLNELFFTPSNIQNISASTLSSLSLETISSLSSSAVSALTSTQLIALTFSQVGTLTVAQLDGLGSTIADTNNAKIYSLGSQIAALSNEVIHNLKAVTIGALSPEELSSLTTGQIGQLTNAQVHAISPSKITALSTAQLTALSIDGSSGLYFEQVKTLNSDQFSTLNSSVLTSLNFNQFGSLTNTNKLTSAQINALHTDGLQGTSNSDTFGINNTNSTSLIAGNVKINGLNGDDKFTITNLTQLTDTPLTHGVIFDGGSGIDSVSLINKNTNPTPGAPTNSILLDLSSFTSGTLPLKNIEVINITGSTTLGSGSETAVNYLNLSVANLLDLTNNNAHHTLRIDGNNFVFKNSVVSSDYLFINGLRSAGWSLAKSGTKVTVDIFGKANPFEFYPINSGWIGGLATEKTAQAREIINGVASGPLLGIEINGGVHYNVYQDATHTNSLLVAAKIPFIL